MHDVRFFKAMHEVKRNQQEKLWSKKTLKMHEITITSLDKSKQMHDIEKKIRTLIKHMRS